MKLKRGIIIVLCFVSVCLAKSSKDRSRPERVRSKVSKRFSMPMGMPSGPGGGGMGGSPMDTPFHAGGGPMGGPGMSSMMGGGGGPMRGPQTGGGMRNNPALPGHTTMFGGSSFGCVRDKIVCPRWCLIIDEFGCHSCPCGPAAGMALPHNMMSGIMSTTTGNYQTSTKTSGGGSECLGQLLCMASCKNSYTLGPVGNDGCRSCTCETGSGYGYGGGAVVNGGTSGGGGVATGSVGGYTGGSTTGGAVTSHVTNQVATNQVTYVVQKHKECTATTLCMQTCETGYQLGAVQTDGCRECVCPPKKQYIYVQPQVEVVQPPKKQYVYTTQVQTYKPVVNTFTCTQSFSCDYGCNVGYKCGADGCPICECIHPQVVGLQVNQVILPQSVQCTSTFSCPNSCQVGYKCGPDGCPTCECLIAVQTEVIDTDCVDCDDIDRFKTDHIKRPQYIRPPKQYVTIETQTGTCHNCETVQPQVNERPQQVVYVQKQTDCTDCETRPNVYYETKPQYVYVEKPKPRPQKVVYVQTQTQTNTCNGCENEIPKVVYEKPRPQVVYVTKPKPQPQRVYVTQTQTCHNCEDTTPQKGHLIQYITGGSSSGRIVGGTVRSGSAAGVITGPAIGMNSGDCPPMPPDCHPSCIKYDTPHCRRCECEQPFPQYSGLLRGRK